MLKIAMLAMAATATSPAIPVTPAVEQIESVVSLPRGAQINRYDRYYAPQVISGRKMIVGTYLATEIVDQEDSYQHGDADWSKRHPERSGRVHVLVKDSDLPLGITDGGCLEIHVYWDVALSKVLRVSCNVFR